MNQIEKRGFHSERNRHPYFLLDALTDRVTDDVDHFHMDRELSWDSLAFYGFQSI